MSQPQKGICAEPNLHAQYILLNVIDEDTHAIRAKLARTLELFEHYDNEHYEAMVTGVVAVPYTHLTLPTSELVAIS